MLSHLAEDCSDRESRFIAVLADVSKNEMLQRDTRTLPNYVPDSLGCLLVR